MAEAAPAGDARRSTTILASVLVVASCGLLYQLVAGTVASWLLGDTVTEFALVLGVYLAAMGLGAFASGRVTTRLAWTFLAIEAALAAMGGMTVPLLLFAQRWGPWLRVALVIDVAVIGALVGAELPLLLRLLRGEMAFRDAVAKALFFDHAGSLLAAVLFPLALVPLLGIVRTGFVAAMGNAAVVLVGSVALRPWLHRAPRGLQLVALGELFALGLGAHGYQRFAALTGE